MPAKVTVALKSEGRQDPPVKWTVKTGPDRKVAFSIGNSSFDCKVDIELDRNGRPVILSERIPILQSREFRISERSSRNLVQRTPHLSRTHRR